MYNTVSSLKEYKLHSKLSLGKNEIKPGHDLSPISKVYSQVNDAEDTLYVEAKQKDNVDALLLLVLSLSLIYSRPTQPIRRHKHTSQVKMCLVITLISYHIYARYITCICIYATLHFPVV